MEFVLHVSYMERSLVPMPAVGFLETYQKQVQLSGMPGGTALSFCGY